YTFTSWAQGSMLLMPPRDASSQQPLYRIIVELDLNPFLPVSHITRIYRCGVHEGELVGEFSLSLNQKRAILSMGNTTTRLSRVLHSINSSPKHFNWVLEHRLRWDCRTSLDDGSPLCICYLPSPSASRSSTSASSDDIQIASFVPPPPEASPPLPEATLTVFPSGHSLFDEIMISGLVVERMLTR
ncbi:hypothetical protein B0H34DRAFT_668086, partial [Crassisporium funariophilum]